MHPRTGESLIYFEDIAAMRSEVFTKRSKEMSPDVIEEQLLSQIHIVSGIASTKMRRVRCAFWLSAPSFVLGLIILAWAALGPDDVIQREQLSDPSPARSRMICCSANRLTAIVVLNALYFHLYGLSRADAALHPRQPSPSSAATTKPPSATTAPKT